MNLSLRCGSGNDGRLLGNIIAMIVVGCVLFAAFFVYDTKFAKVPILSKQFIKNKSIVAASWIGFLDFVSLVPLSSRDLPTLEHPGLLLHYLYLPLFICRRRQTMVRHV